jgi:hypothetical protein
VGLGVVEGLATKKARLSGEEKSASGVLAVSIVFFYS